MPQLTVIKTKDYLLLKIPLKAIKEREILVSSQEEKAVMEGLKALEEGRVSKVFNNTEEALSFLRNI